MKTINQGEGLIDEDADKHAGASALRGITRPYSVVDLFSGCGGLSLGFTLTRRFRSVAALDNNPAATETFAMNNTDEPAVLTTDIRGRETRESLLGHLRDKGIKGSGQLHCLIGGPPCEGFSQNRVENGNGNTKSRTTKFTDDPRNRLFKWFMQIADELRPWVIVIENVPDILRHRDGATAQEIISDLSSMGYHTVAKVLNAADYGVPQLRRRAFFIAYRQEHSSLGTHIGFPEPTHLPFPLANETLDLDPEWCPGDMGYWPTAREAIGDLPPATTSKSADAWVDYNEVKSRSSFLRRFLRATQLGGTWNHVARPLGPNSLARVRQLDEWENDEVHRWRRSKVHYHYSYSRLRWSEPSRTITKFVYHVGSGMFCHPEDDRAVTMREAARLQTFPDEFKFPALPIRDLSSLIGSAVPPLLAHAIAREIVRHLDGVTFAQLGKRGRSGLRPLQGDAVVRRLEKGQWGSTTATEEEPLPLL